MAVMMVEQLAEKWVDKWAALTVDKMVVPMGETRAVMKVVGMALQMAEPTVDEMAAPTVAMMAGLLVGGMAAKMAAMTAASMVAM